jgi:hypothetical protein
LDSKVKTLVSNDIAWAVEQINELYRKGEIKGLNVQIMLKDGEFITGSSGDISFLEKIGLIETAKHDIFLKADGFIE